MGKIINVDFKKKRKEFAWDDDAEMRIKVTEQINKDFHHILDKVVFLTGDDKIFQEYVARTLGAINANLQHRINEQF